MSSNTDMSAFWKQCTQEVLISFVAWFLLHTHTHTHTQSYCDQVEAHEIEVSVRKIIWLGYNIACYMVWFSALASNAALLYSKCN